VGQLKIEFEMCDIVNQDLLRVTGENNKPEECKDFRALKGVL